MHSARLAEESVSELIGDLKDETKTLIQQEVELAKTEISEKISRFGRSAALVALGGFVAYAGLIVFLIGLGFLLSFALHSLELNPLLANFIGTGFIGLLAAGVGYAF